MMEFKPTELETINIFKELMHYNELEQLLEQKELPKGNFETLNTYLSNLDKLIEFKPVLVSKENIFKFDRDRHLMTKRAFIRELERLKKEYDNYKENIDKDSKLFTFLTKDTDILRTQILRKVNSSNIVFVDFDGCNQNIPHLDACPSFSLNEQDIISSVINTIFNYCFKVDKTNEWAKVACEYSLRENLNVEDDEVTKRLQKLTEYMRHGVDTDTAERLFLYKDMIKEKTDKNDTKFWRIDLPKREGADRAWINIKHENISEHDTDTDMMKVFLTKDIAYNIHYIKDDELKTKWINGDEEIIPALKEISDKYEAWIKDSQTPTFIKKLTALGVGKNNEDFTIAANNGEYYIAIDFNENEIQGSLYNNKFHLEDGYSLALKEDDETLKVIGRIFERLLGSSTHKISALAKCNQDIFKAKVAENKKISDYKLIAAIDEMSANDDKRNDLAKAMARKETC